MDENPPLDKETIKNELTEIIEPAKKSLTWEDWNYLRGTIASAAAYLSEQKATENQISQARTALLQFVSDVMTRVPTVRNDWFVTTGSQPIDHDVFLSSHNRFLPCPPFCK
jgi:hypothetical protein